MAISSGTGRGCRQTRGEPTHRDGRRADDALASAPGFIGERAEDEREEQPAPSALEACMRAGGTYARMDVDAPESEEREGRRLGKRLRHRGSEGPRGAVWRIGPRRQAASTSTRA